MLERLQKTMAAVGVGSRRTCEELIRKGVVQVNGETVTELGTKVDPNHAQISVNGEPIARLSEAKRKSQFTYIKLHKPRDVLSDIGGQTYGRKSVADLLPPGTNRVFAVGRLDLNSEGLVLLTDDGELANKLTHPRYQHPKTYYVLVEKRPSPKELEQLCKGVKLPDGHITAPAQFTIVDRLPPELRLAKDGRKFGAWLKVILREGKKRQIRHMTAAVGHPTLRLVRWSIGPLTLGNLPVGQNSPLTRKEVGGLRALSGKATKGRGPGSRAGGRTSSRTGSRKTDGGPAGGSPPRRKPGGKPAGKSAGKSGGGKQGDGRKPERGRAEERKPGSRRTAGNKAAGSKVIKVKPSRDK